MKRFFSSLFCTFFLGIVLCSAQVTFNKRISFDRPNFTRLNSVEVTDSCYYVNGILVDTNPPYKTGNLFGKISLEGEVEWYKELVSMEQSYEVWANTFQKANGTNDFFGAGYSIKDSEMFALLLKYDEHGDTIFTKKYFSPNVPNDYFMALTSTEQLADKSLLLSSNISDPISLKTDINIIKTDSVGDVVWSKIYGTESWIESGASIVETDEGYVIGGWQTNLNFVSIDYVMRTYIFCIDSIGNVLWEYLSPENELQYKAQDMLVIEDGGLIIASEKGTEHVSGQAAIVTWQNYVFKLNANQEFEWGVDLRSGRSTSTNYLYKIIEISNGSGYLVSGYNHEPNFEENGLDHYGTIVKISPAGDSLWTRRYQYVDSPQDDHFFYDVEETPDGGFVMVGQAKDALLSAPTPRQQAWIVKVDQYGCLVPGCQLVSATEAPLMDVKISLYPNPASDFLNVYYYHPNHRGEVQFRITDIQGRIVHRFVSNQNDITLMIPVNELSPGQYFLSTQTASGLLRTEGFIINR